MSTKFIAEKSSPQMQKILEYLQNIGEQFRMDGFDSSKLAEDLNSFRTQSSWKFEPTRHQKMLLARTHRWMLRVYLLCVCSC